MVNSTLLLLVIALTFSSNNSSVIKSATSRANLIVGSVGPSDRLLHRSYHYKYAIPNYIQSEDLSYRGYGTTNITAVFATEVGYTQYASAWIISGGIWRSNVTVRVQSGRGYGYNYMIEVWGR